MHWSHYRKAGASSSLHWLLLARAERRAQLLEGVENDTDALTCSKKLLVIHPILLPAPLESLITGGGASIEFLLSACYALC